MPPEIRSVIESLVAHQEARIAALECELQSTRDELRATQAELAATRTQLATTQVELAKARKTAIEQHDYELARTYLESEWPTMADRTRSSILTGVMGILQVFNTGLVRELVSTGTNVTPDDLFAGKWVLVDMAHSEWGDIGHFVAAGWKYLTQRAILRRVAGPDANVVTCWIDEAQAALTSFDAHFLAQCRSHQGCAVYLSQSLPGYYAALGGEKGRHSVDALLAGFQTRIFHALGDLETAEYASKLVGRSLQTFTRGTGCGSRKEAAMTLIADRLTRIEAILAVLVQGQQAREW